MFVAAACALALLAGCNNGGEKTAQTPPSVAGASIGTLNWAVSTPWRIQPERDKYRHPMQTLSFFGVRNDATVIEISPGAGWYTSILAPYIKEGGGRFIVATFDPANATPQQKTALDDFKKRFVDKPEIFGQIEMVPFSKTSGTLGPDNSADFVLTFRNVHNWAKAGNAEAMFQTFHDLLKPGGVLGVEEHRAKPGTPVEQQIATGYMTEQFVIDAAVKAGFRLVGKAEINANPKDTKDYPDGVWTLPPTLKLGDQDKARFLAIGESDRMTLKFVKP